MNWMTTGPESTNDDVAVAAYLFGELDAIDRAAFEQRLASDPALRERLAEFEATEDLVRSALNGSPTLSMDAHARLALAAQHRPRRRIALLRVAVAATVLGAATMLLERGRVPVADSSIMLVGFASNPDGSSAATSMGEPTAAISPEATTNARAALSISTSSTDSFALQRSPGEVNSTTLALVVNPGETNAESHRALGRTALTSASEPGINVQGRRGAIGVGQPRRVEFDTFAFKSPQLGKILPPGAEITEEDGSPFGAEVGIDPETAKLLSAIGYASNPSRSQPDSVVADGLRFDAASILRVCDRRPGERPADMYFRFFGDNGFERADGAPLSTFGIDVDTASYALAREYLERGIVPEKAQIRTEEFINWFRPDVTVPEGVPLWISSELGPSPFGGDPNRRMLRVVVRGREYSRAERPRMNLELVVDTSGSMQSENRLELVKNAIRLLVAKLEPNDSLGIVRFSDQASVVVPLARLSDRAAIEAAIAALAPQQSTNAEAGLKLGFEQIAAGFDVEASNHVVLFSDGVANVGNVEPTAILNSVAEQRGKGIYLSTIGVGFGNHNDALLEQLADKGDGSCAYVDSEKEAMRAIVDRFSGAFQPVARNVKIQVEFDPRQIARYRLLGYENRALAAADFRNDAVDAGELGAGAQVCALYEIEPAAEFGNGGATPAVTSRVRWLPPHGRGDSPGETGCAVFGNQEAKSFDATSLGFRRSVLVAQFAEFLRRSTHALTDSFDDLVKSSESLAPTLNDPDFTQFVALVKKSRDLVLATLPKSDPLREAIDAVRRNRILKAEIEDAAAAKKANGADPADVLKQLEEENRRLEELLKRLLGK